MTSFNRSSCWIALIGFATATGAYAQINSAAYHPRTYNDVPGSLLTVVSNYPSLIAFSDRNVSAPTGFANRHVWQFSADSGVTAYKFGNDTFFTVSMTVTLTGDPAAPRKEAGFLLDTIGGQGQFIVNTDGHEIVAFGGPLPFYAFPATFQSGDTVTLGMTYFRGADGKRYIIYSANCLQSPPKEFTNLEQGIIDNSTLGGYLQVVNAPTVATNSGVALFQDIQIGPPDQDFDGVPDSEDNCPNTPPCTIVNAHGCSLDQLVPCAGPASGGTWKNHGAYVSAFAHAVNAFRKAGLISGEESGLLVAEAAQSDCGKKARQTPPRPAVQARPAPDARAD